MGKGKRLKAERYAVKAEREALLEVRRTAPVAVQVLCPVTHTYVDPGLHMDVATFNAGQFTGLTFGCRECGGEHALTEDDMVLST